jgi:hypothetical protein
VTPRAHARSALRRGPQVSLQGISLLETSAIISLTGVLLAAFVPTFVRHVRMSKIAEAVEELDSLYNNVASYYSTEHQIAGQRLTRCLPESVGPLPAAPSPDPQVVDFDAPETPSKEIWNSLGQAGQQAFRYSYQVIVAQPGCGPRKLGTGSVVTFRATGDLDGDGVPSTIERNAALSSDQSKLEPFGPLHVRQRVE